MWEEFVEHWECDISEGAELISEDTWTKTGNIQLFDAGEHYVLYNDDFYENATPVIAEEYVNQDGAYAFPFAGEAIENTESKVLVR